jgi:hypothetical protein
VRLPLHPGRWGRRACLLGVLVSNCNDLALQCLRGTLVRTFKDLRAVAGHTAGWEAS